MPIELSPALFLTTWAAGLAAAAAVVAWWRVVGPGFGWLSGSVIVLFGATGWVAGGGWAALVATAAALAGVATARRPAVSAGAYALASTAYWVSSVPDGGMLASATGAIALGGVTGEMILGHWYLIDPTLPRWALKRLAVAGAGGIALDGLVVGLDGSFSFQDETVIAWAFVVLAATSLALMVAVRLALNEPSYPGVMAATGLSYLGSLTTIGAAVAGRAVLDGGLLAEVTGKLLTS